MKQTITKENVYDKMHNSNRRAVIQGTFKALNEIQDEAPDIQINAIACLLLLVCNRFEIEPSTALRCVENLVKQTRRYDKASIEGLKEYCQKEL